MFSFLTYAVLENCIIVSLWRAFEAINLHVFLSKSLSTRSSKDVYGSELFLSLKPMIQTFYSELQNSFAEFITIVGENKLLWEAELLVSSYLHNHTWKILSCSQPCWLLWPRMKGFLSQNMIVIGRGRTCFVRYVTDTHPSARSRSDASL